MYLIADRGGGFLCGTHKMCLVVWFHGFSENLRVQCISNFSPTEWKLFSSPKGVNMLPQSKYYGPLPLTSYLSPIESFLMSSFSFLGSTQTPGERSGSLGSCLYFFLLFTFTLPSPCRCSQISLIFKHTPAPENNSTACHFENASVSFICLLFF